jgi:iron complex outermembrane receptor protein
LGNSLFRAMLLASGSATAAIVVSPAVAHAQEQNYNIDIPAQSMGDALRALGQATRQNVIFDGSVVRGKRSVAVRGNMSPSEALNRMLGSSGLVVSKGAGGTLMVRLGNGQATDSAKSLRAAASATDTTSQEDSTEIIVTATKRSTNLQTTPAAISVVSAEDIATRHLGGADDYLAGLPGVSYQERGTGSNSITIRGIGQGSQLDTNSPVGTYFGETPVSGLGSAVNGNQAGNSDIKLIDIQQVEVLRGPQGTLYGSGTMGGTVRVVPKGPNLNRVEGAAYGEYSNTARFGSSNYKLQGVVNAPLIEDILGVRVVAYRFFDDGYYKNAAGSRPTATDLAVKAIVPSLALRDDDHIGTATSNGFRGTVLFKPTDRLSLTVMYINQTDKTSGVPSEDIALGKYTQSRVGVGLNGEDRESVSTKISLTNVVGEYDLGFGKFLNSTSIISTEGASDIEVSFASPAIFAGVDAVATNKKDVFINEARFTSAFKGPVQLLGGVYYENRRFDTNNTFAFQYRQSPIPPQSSFALGPLLTKNFQRQLAFFGEASLTMLDDKLTLTGGGRYFKFNLGVPLATAFGVVQGNQGQHATITGTNWKGSISYEINKSFFAYGLFSEGFRAPILQAPVRYDLYDPDNNGLLNFQDGIERSVPEGLLAPDSTRNYEIGLNFKSPSGAIRGKIDAYLIDWTGIPITPSLTVNGGAAYFINAGKARSKGVEFEISARLPGQVDLSSSVSYTDSVLAETQAGLGVKGTRLPGSSRWNAHAAVQKNFSVGGHDSYLRVDYTYVGSYYGDLGQTPPTAGGYGLVNAGAGINLGKLDLSVFAKNIGNSSAATWYDNAFIGRAYRLRPRTIGVSAGFKF